MRLMASGPRIAYLNGTEVRLVGTYYPEPYVLAHSGANSKNASVISSDFAAMKAMGANAIKTYLHSEYWYEHFDEDIALIDEMVDAAYKNGMYIMLCWWETNTGADNPKIIADYAAAEGILSHRYGNCSNVIFGTYPEPVQAPGNATLYWETWRPSAQYLYDIIRANTSNLISVSSAAWAYNFSTVGSSLLNGTNIVYERHQYPGLHRLNSWYNAQWGTVHTQVPVIIGEWCATPESRIITENDLRPQWVPSYHYTLLFVYYYLDNGEDGSFNQNWDGIYGTQMVNTSFTKPTSPDYYRYHTTLWGKFVADNLWTNHTWPLASFVNTTVIESVPARFNDTSRNATSWTWQWDDGTVNSSGRNVTHTFRKPGTYSVTLYVANVYGNDSVTVPIIVNKATIAS